MSFVRDHVELRIGYSVIRSLTDPTGSIDGMAWSFPRPGAADRLREYIGRTLLEAELQPADHLRLTFDGSATIEISLRPDDRTGPEAAHFIPANEVGGLDPAGMWVWQLRPSGSRSRTVPLSGGGLGAVLALSGLLGDAEHGADL